MDLIASLNLWALLFHISELKMSGGILLPFDRSSSSCDQFKDFNLSTYQLRTCISMKYSAGDFAHHMSLLLCSS